MSRWRLHFVNTTTVEVEAEKVVHLEETLEFHDGAWAGIGLCRLVAVTRNVTYVELLGGEGEERGTAPE